MEFQINDYMLTRECDSLAEEIFEEIKAEAGDDFDPDQYQDDMSDRAHQVADGHEWVIYTYKAHMLCAHCNVDNGEQFLEDTGMPEDPTYDRLGTIIAYGEMRARIEGRIQEQCDEFEAG